jgi:hypothetical protein
MVALKNFSLVEVVHIIGFTSVVRGHPTGQGRVAAP